MNGYLATFIDVTKRNTAQRELNRIAMMDNLTKLPNRMYIESLRDRFLAKLKRDQGFGAYMVIDLDHFKQLNDLYGHFAGDHLLVLMGTLLDEACRSQDCAVRWGGEEFVWLLPNADLTTTLQRAEQLRCRFTAENFSWYGEQISATFSAGCSCGRLDAEGSLSSKQQLLLLLQQADDALYQAKQQGRNRVMAG